MQWKVEPNKNIFGIDEGPVFTDYCQFAVGFRTPANRKPYVWIFAEVVYYRYMGDAPIFPEELKDKLWLDVDPQGAEVITPSDPPTIAYPKEVSIVRINAFKISQSWSSNTTVLKRGEMYTFWLNLTWGLKNTQVMIGVEVYDSSGQLVSGSWVLASSWVYNVSTYCEFGTAISKIAALGSATIEVTVKTDWPEKKNYDFIPKITIPIRIEGGYYE